jgi:hypothetical protein
MNDLKLKGINSNTARNGELLVRVSRSATLREIGLVLQQYMADDCNMNVADSMNSSSGTMWAQSSRPLIKELPNGFMICDRDDSSSGLTSLEIHGEWPAHDVVQYTNNSKSTWIYTQTSKSTGSRGCPYVCVEGMENLEFPVSGGTYSGSSLPRDAFCMCVEDNDREKPIVADCNAAKWFKTPLSSLDRLRITLRNSDGSLFPIDDSDRAIFIFDVYCES